MWITGLCDRSACFKLTITLRSTGRWVIHPEFVIYVKKARYENILKIVKDYFGGIGTIYYQNNSAGYRVGSVKDIVNVIIPHFVNYPLLSTKISTFTLWSKAIYLMYNGEHKQDSGRHEIYSIHAAINQGPSKSFKTHFPNWKPAKLPSYSLNISPEELSNWWVSGYFSMYCNFNVDLNPHGLKNSYYYRVVPSFNFSRNIVELPLLTLLASYFGVTVNQRSDNLRVDVNIYKLDKNMDIVDLFESYPLMSCKQKEFEIWARIIKDAVKLRRRPCKISLSRYIKHFFDLNEKLVSVRKLNN